MSVFAQTSGLPASPHRGPTCKQCSCGNEGIMHALNVEVWIIFKVTVLKTRVPRLEKQEFCAPRICPRCGKCCHWARECKSKPVVLSRPVPGNEERGQPQAPSYSKKTAYRAINLLSSQQDQFLSFSGQTQEIQI